MTVRSLERDAVTVRGGSSAARSHLAGRAASGVRWGLVGSFGKQAGLFLGVLVLARLLGPRNYGIVAPATLYVAFVTFLQDQGFGAALIQKRELDDRDVGSVFWLNTVSSLALVGATLGLAPLVAGFFHMPELEAVLRVLAVTVVLRALTIVPRSLLDRRMDYRTLAVVDLCSVAGGTVAGVLAAVGGAGYWALVVQTLVTDLIAVAVLHGKAGRPHLGFSLGSLRGMLSFSGPVMASRLVLYAHKHVDNLLIGRVLGATPLAYYALSYRVLNLPLFTLGHIMNQVAFSSFSRLQEEPERVRRWYGSAVVAVTATTYPLLTVAVLGIPDLLPWVFGAAWSPAAPTMQVLVSVAFGIIAMMLGTPLYMALARTRLMLAWQMATAVLSIGAFAFGVRWGTVGVAACYGVVVFGLLPGNILSISRVLGVPVRRYVGWLVPASASSAALAAVWWLVRPQVDALGAPPPLALAASSAAALAAYLIVLRACFPAATASVLRLGRMVAGRGTIDLTSRQPG